MKHISKNRLEAFSDGVIAILITIMILEFKPPESLTLEGLKPLVSTFFTYLLSYVYLAIYWNNHHHMLHTVQHINGRIMWANLHLLFWLSLFPFVTAWVGKTQGAPLPTALYGVVFLMAALAYWVLQKAIIQFQGQGSHLAQAIGSARKEKLSIFCYVAAIGCAFLLPWFSTALYILVALIWVIPDKRIEQLAHSKK